MIRHKSNRIIYIIHGQFSGIFDDFAETEKRNLQIFSKLFHSAKLSLYLFGL